MNIGNMIREMRNERGLSQEKLAEMLNVTRQTVSNWENNRNYPDLSTLVKISETFNFSLDQALREDRTYIKVTDDHRHKARARKLVIASLALIILALFGTMMWLLINVGKGTADGDRITTETVVKMAVNLPGQTPSRAITKTYDAASFDDFSEIKKNDILESVTGTMEGDIPCIYIDSKERSEINFVFQNDNYEDIAPKINTIELYTANGLPPDIIKRTDKDVHYMYEEGMLKIFAADFIERKELTFGNNITDDDTYISTCYFRIRYTFEGNEYISVTAVNVLPDDDL